MHKNAGQTIWSVRHFLCRQPLELSGGFNMLKLKGVKKSDFGLNGKSEKDTEKLLNNYPYNAKIRA